jgi:hypothetical protein
MEGREIRGIGKERHSWMGMVEWGSAEAGKDNVRNLTVFIEILIILTNEY